MTLKFSPLLSQHWFLQSALELNVKMPRHCKMDSCRFGTPKVNLFLRKSQVVWQMKAKVYKHLCFAAVNPRYMSRFVSMMLATKMKV